MEDIDNLKKPDIWRIQLTIPTNFMSSEDPDEEHFILSKSDNVEIMADDDAHEVTSF